MANRIAGITVEIGGDMTKRSKALSSIAAGKRLPLTITVHSLWFVGVPGFLPPAHRPAESGPSDPYSKGY